MDLFKLLGAPRPDEPSDASTEADIDIDRLIASGVPVRPSDQNRELLEPLLQVIDPEIGINVVDLGLVYAVEQDGARVDVVLTMTTPACPLSAMIEDEVRHALLEAVAGVEQVRVAVIFEPAWRPEMMSDAARARLGG